MVRIVLESPLIDAEKGARIFPPEIECFQSEDEDDSFKSGEALSPNLPRRGPSPYSEIDIAQQYKSGQKGLPFSNSLFYLFQGKL
jgi:hypothetical protein